MAVARGAAAESPASTQETTDLEEVVVTGSHIRGTDAAGSSAPVRVGGDVKPAKLLTSVPPLYPTFAKNQRVEGDVRVDAMVDVNGRVTAAKAVSGPTLLQQAAVDALRQWKYQPATLDGKPVPMRLTVTIQFRIH